MKMIFAGLRSPCHDGIAHISDLLASQIDEIEAVINYRIALVSLYLSEGSLLERCGARIES